MVDEFTHAYADVDGVRLHWAELGTGSAAPPLVLLHGIGDSYLSWHPVAAALARDRRVLMPDLPGCGLSSRPDASYSLTWVAQVIADWLAQLGLGSVDLVGHSYGGGVAQMLLLACPGRVRRMVLEASGGLGRGLGFWLRLASFPHAVEHWGQPFMAFGTTRTFARVKGAEARADARALAAMNAVRGTARAFSRMVRDVIDWHGQTRQFLQRATEIAAFPPLAVFWGDGDELIPMTHGRSFTEAMEGVPLYVFPRAGHYIHHDCPALFVERLQSFLADAHARPARLRPAPRARPGAFRRAASEPASRHAP
jgi:pimeloyl-ACP methyl ester carboxylesterase